MSTSTGRNVSRGDLKTIRDKANFAWSMLDICRVSDEGDNIQYRLDAMAALGQIRQCCESLMQGLPLATIDQDRVLEVIGELIKRAEPITYGQVNNRFITPDYLSFLAYEKNHPEVGLTENGWSTLSLIATITEILCGRRLAFKFELVEGAITDASPLVGVCWYSSVVPAGGQG